VVAIEKRGRDKRSQLLLRASGRQVARSPQAHRDFREQFKLPLGNNREAGAAQAPNVGIGDPCRNPLVACSARLWRSPRATRRGDARYRNVKASHAWPSAGESWAIIIVVIVGKRGPRKNAGSLLPILGSAESQDIERTPGREADKAGHGSLGQVGQHAHR
jgi:hypothetical protein